MSVRGKPVLMPNSTCCANTLVAVKKTRHANEIDPRTRNEGRFSEQRTNIFVLLIVWLHVESRMRAECASRKKSQVRMGLKGVINPRTSADSDTPLVRFSEFFR